LATASTTATTTVTYAQLKPRHAVSQGHLANAPGPRYQPGMGHALGGGGIQKGLFRAVMTDQVGGGDGADRIGGEICGRLGHGF
jgi:hypothetical protein